MIKLSADQKKALENLLSWHKNVNKSQFVTLGGYAGTGKTTLIGILRQKLLKENSKLKIAFVSYTGKATRVLRNKLIEANSLCGKDTVGTIHSLIYSPIEDEVTQEIIGWKKKEVVEADLIVVDEASMVDRTIWEDLLSYGVPIIAVGDHGQLPPIRENFNLMAKPELKLEEIHRQAKENPVIKISIMAREQGAIPFGNFGRGVKKITRDDGEVTELLQNYNSETLVLCGYNFTRIKLNAYIRQALGFDAVEPQTNDRVICLRNNRTKQIYNGMLGRIKKIKPQNENWYKAEINLDGEVNLYKGKILVSQFNSREPMNFTKDRYRIMDGDLFDFGYALTVHKAQGSQARKVILFEERFPKMDEEQWRRWLYTGVTRAEEELFVVG